MSKKSKNVPKKPYRSEEFEAFIKVLGSGTRPHWIQIAETLGVDKNTINRWKKHPRAQEAIKEGINSAMDRMEKTGARDWRMWQEKLKMLGVQAIDKAQMDLNASVTFVIDDSLKQKDE